jgi:serine/threonine protein kinase/Flp pilus assembly protein TadD
MNARNPSEEEIFEAARQVSDPEQRAAYLRTACGSDEELRQRIGVLLREHENAGEFLDKSPAALSAEAPIGTTRMVAVTEKSGDRIGHYKLLQKIGEGGCGVVYMAEQEKPFRRRVALKIIKLGMDTKQVVGRFEAERQALALMDHPNIAKVLDAGATETGRPYFVMELVRGIRITDYCDQNSLSTEERLKLFIVVCQAIQHAHQKGIIHRDIKPSNVLVTLHDGVPVPKVIDFGIAKATTDQPLTDKTIFTAFEQFIGTPAYVSPEQAEMGGLDIDTRSDVYALGVLLYELLTGRTPFDPRTLLQAGLDQMRRIIREQEPPRPSTRLSTLDDADLKAVARQRQAEPPRLISIIRGDLDWIVMKCLEKDRTRRFETVSTLALDVKKHLQNEPIIARPPGQLYRLGKFIRRKKLAFAASAVVALGLIIGSSVTIWLVHKSKEARRDKIEADKAQRRLRQEIRVRELKLHGNDQQAREDWAGAESSYRQAVELQMQMWDGGDTDVARSLDDLAYVLERQKNLAEEEKTCRQALEIRRKVLGEKHPYVADSLDRLAAILDREGKRADEEDACKEALAIRKKTYGNEHRAVAESLCRLGWALWHGRKFSEAEATQRDALAMRRKLLGNEHREVGESLRALAFALKDQGKLAEAEALMREELEESRGRRDAGYPGVAEVLTELEDVMLSQHKLAELEQLFNELLPPGKESEPQSVELLRPRGNFRARRGEWQGAASDLAKAVAADPGNVWDWLELGSLLVETGDVAGYRQHRQAMLARFGATQDAATAEQTAKACLVLPAVGPDLDAASRLADMAVALGKETPWMSYFQFAKGLAEYRQGNFDRAVEWVQKALSKEGSDSQLEVQAYMVLAMACHQLDHAEQAHTALAKGVEIAKKNCSRLRAVTSVIHITTGSSHTLSCARRGRSLKAAPERAKQNERCNSDSKRHSGRRSKGRG